MTRGVVFWASAGAAGASNARPSRTNAAARQPPSARVSRNPPRGARAAGQSSGGAPRKPASAPAMPLQWLEPGTCSGIPAAPNRTPLPPHSVRPWPACNTPLPILRRVTKIEFPGDGGLCIEASSTVTGTVNCTRDGVGNLNSISLLSPPNTFHRPRSCPGRWCETQSR